ncbi:hypothetical protein [Methylobacterium sp. R2-1]|uniref:hypothetical protein n=1 Tax=Methylobacterium sp. R2-1 TaxID=2587064 RepID=UPI00161BE3D0|nr:hypothetical protein [Methylobacterium sp. R2-1]MBB2965162.1 hypothetical protein [Methylobacterium sp. R2-1]
MSERVSDAAYWIAANGADDPENAQTVQAALVSPGDWGPFTVRREGFGKVVVGPISSLLLPDEDAEMAFALLLEEYVGES